MVIITVENEYEKAIVNLALREYASRELQKAVTLLEGGDLKNGRDASSRGETASKIANSIR